MSEPQARPVASLPPHPVLRHFYESAGERQQVVTAMFDDAAVHYDRVTTLMSLGAGARYRRQSLQRVGVASGSRVLDVACGTGQLSEAAIRVVGSTGSVIGVDPSFEMRRVAETRGVAGVGRGIVNANRLVAASGFFGERDANLTRRFQNLGEGAPESIEAAVEMGTLLCGAPSTVIDQIARLRAAIGCGVLEVSFAAPMGSGEAKQQAMTLFAREVMPALRNA